VAYQASTGSGRGGGAGAGGGLLNHMDQNYELNEVDNFAEHHQARSAIQ